MRLYRGLTKEGKWVYGWYCCTKKHQYSTGIEPERHFIIQEDSECMLDQTEPYFIYDISSAVRVIPETIGQSTGLKDNTKWRSLTCQERDDWINAGNTSDNWNGKEIYEGDVIQEYYESIDHTSRATQVIWINDDCCFGLIPSNPYQYTRLHYSEDREVIGNIHQNPELLQEHKDE